MLTGLTNSIIINVQSSLPQRVKDWVVDKRIRQKDDGSWWSDVNPQARALSYERILGSDCGEEAMETIREEEVSASTAAALLVFAPP